MTSNCHKNLQGESNQQISHEKSQNLKLIKALLLKQLSQFHSQNIIRNSSNQKYKAEFFGLYLYVDISSSGRSLQKQAISKKINDLKGKTRLSYTQDNTEYIVVDSDFFNYPQKQGEMNSWIGSNYITRELNDFLIKESLSIWAHISASKKGTQPIKISDSTNSVQNSLKPDSQVNYYTHSGSKRQKELLSHTNAKNLCPNFMISKLNLSQSHQNQNRNTQSFTYDEKVYLDFIEKQQSIAKYQKQFEKQTKNRIIDVKHLDYAMEFILSKTPEWHNKRNGILHSEMPKRINYDKAQDFVISKIEFLNDSHSMNGYKSHQKQQIMEYEKQAYHQFELIKDDDQKSGFVPKDYTSQFDIHQLVLDGPKGMDPCQTFNQKRFGQERKQQIETYQRKTESQAKIKAMSESEGVQHPDHDVIDVPRPQVYHTYCQICNMTYENFDDHIITETHQRKARHQAQLSQIDVIIKELDIKKSWESNWPPEPVKPKISVPIKYQVLKNGKILTMDHERLKNLGQENICKQRTFMEKITQQSRSGRASAAGKASKTSHMKSPQQPSISHHTPKGKTPKSRSPCVNDTEQKLENLNRPTLAEQILNSRQNSTQKKRVQKIMEKSREQILLLVPKYDNRKYSEIGQKEVIYEDENLDEIEFSAELKQQKVHEPEEQEDDPKALDESCCQESCSVMSDQEEDEDYKSFPAETHEEEFAIKKVMHQTEAPKLEQNNIEEDQDEEEEAADMMDSDERIERQLQEEIKSEQQSQMEDNGMQQEESEHTYEQEADSTPPIESSSDLQNQEEFISIQARPDDGEIKAEKKTSQDLNSLEKKIEEISQLQAILKGQKMGMHQPQFDEQKFKQFEDVKQQIEEPIKMLQQQPQVVEDQISIKLQEVDWVEQQEQTNDDILECFEISNNIIEQQMPILLENPLAASVSIETINEMETNQVELSIDQVGQNTFSQNVVQSTRYRPRPTPYNKDVASQLQDTLSRQIYIPAEIEPSLKMRKFYLQEESQNQQSSIEEISQQPELQQDEEISCQIVDLQAEDQIEEVTKRDVSLSPQKQTIIAAPQQQSFSAAQSREKSTKEQSSSYQQTGFLKTSGQSQSLLKANDNQHFRTSQNQSNNNTQLIPRKECVYKPYAQRQFQTMSTSNIRQMRTQLPPKSHDPKSINLNAAKSNESLKDLFKTQVTKHQSKRNYITKGFQTNSSAILVQKNRINQRSTIQPLMNCQKIERGINRKRGFHQISHQVKSIHYNTPVRLGPSAKRLKQ